MKAALNRHLKQLPADYGRQLWRSLLSVLRDTSLSGETGATLVPVLASRRMRVIGRSPRMLNALAKSRD